MGDLVANSNAIGGGHSLHAGHVYSLPH
jgi:hypothetical protein